MVELFFGYTEKSETIMNFLDFHCHLDAQEYGDCRQEIVDECFNTGVSKLVTIIDPFRINSYEDTIKVLRANENVFCMVAAHPHEADNYNMKIEKNILRISDGSAAIGLGEAGLDFHYNFAKPENQIKVFKRQIAIAQELKMPLTVHSRKAEREVLRILEAENFLGSVIFHCFTGDVEEAKIILERGYYISFSGIITFKKEDLLREIVQIIPLNRIFSETDSPYLSPEPFRGKVNRPVRVRLVAEKLAEIKGVTVGELNTQISNNFKTLFGF